MRNVINYYYQMNVYNIHLVHGIYYFTSQNDSYLFVPYDKNIEFFPAIYALNQELIRINPYYYEIILNIEGLPYIYVNQKCYCLLKSSSVIHDSMSFYDLPLTRVSVSSKFSSLIRFPWTSFWMKKLDYFEEVLEHFDKELQQLLPIFLYYMGLGENAISYIQYVLDSVSKERQDELVVSHHRIDVHMSVSELYNPLNLVLDYPARDVSEYLKSLFYSNEYDFTVIEEYIHSLNFSTFGYSLLFGRMLYPSFFFDICDAVSQERAELEKILVLGERREEYQLYLKEIYYIIRKKADIEEVRWILRN